MTITAAQLVDKAARAARIPGIENAVDPATQQLGLEIFNDILDQIGGAATTIPNQTLVTFSTVINQQEYTNGVGAYDINAPQIMSVMEMFMSTQNETVRYYLSPLNEQMNANLSAPENKGLPNWYLMRKLADEVTTFKLYPVPDRVYDVTIVAKQRLANVLPGTQLGFFPREWVRSFKWWIAADLRDYFALEDSPSITAKSKEGQALFKAMNALDMSIRKDYWIDGRRSYSSWRTAGTP